MFNGHRVAPGLGYWWAVGIGFSDALDNPRRQGLLSTGIIRMGGPQGLPRFSIITAALNALPGLKATADSLRAQTFRDFEHIVVDGESGDGTPQWLAAQGESIRWISEPDGSIADALNKALEVARGDYVLVLHAQDTLLSPDSLAEAASELDGSDIVSFDVVFSTAKDDRLLRSRGFSSKLEFKTTIPHQGAFCRRDLFDRIGVFDKTFRVALDYEFFLRACRSGASVRRVHRPLAHMPDTGISSRRDWASLRARFAEERRAQMLHCPGLLMRGVYAMYWPSYLAYRRLRSALSGSGG